MEWIKKLAGYAPDIATAIATGGTSLVASTALRIAAKELVGDESADISAVQGAVELATPEQMTAMVKANNDFNVKMAEIGLKQVQAVNQTMQVESKSEHWWQYTWRPFWGFVSALAFLAFVVLIGILAYRAIMKADANAMVMIPQLISSATMLFGIPAAILGVASWHRGKEKRIRAGELFKS